MVHMHKYLEVPFFRMHTHSHPPLLVLYSELPFRLEQIINMKPLDSLSTKCHLFLSESTVFWKFFPSKYALEIPVSTACYLHFCFCVFPQKARNLARKKKRWGKKTSNALSLRTVLSCCTHFRKGHMFLFFSGNVGYLHLQTFILPTFLKRYFALP